MKSVVNENDQGGRKLPLGTVSGAAPASAAQAGPSTAPLEVSRLISPARTPAKPARIEISWQVSPEQSVAIVNLTGRMPKSDLPILSATVIPPGPQDWCYL